MTKTIALNNPVLDMISHMNYSQRVAKIFWENTNTLEMQDRSTTKLIDKKMDFLAYNLERMIDLPKIPNFNRIEATSTALNLDKIRQEFWSLSKDDLKKLLNILEVLREGK